MQGQESEDTVVEGGGGGSEQTWAPRNWARHSRVAASAATVSVSVCPLLDGGDPSLLLEIWMVTSSPGRLAQPQTLAIGARVVVLLGLRVVVTSMLG